MMAGRPPHCLPTAAAHVDLAFWAPARTTFNGHGKHTSMGVLHSKMWVGVFVNWVYPNLIAKEIIWTLYATTCKWSSATGWVICRKENKYYMKEKCKFDIAYLRLLTHQATLVQCHLPVRPHVHRLKENDTFHDHKSIENWTARVDKKLADNGFCNLYTPNPL